MLRELKDCKMSKEFIHMFLCTCLEKEWKIPLLLQYLHLVCQKKRDTSSLQEVVEEIKDVEVEEGHFPHEVRFYKFYEQHISSLSPYIVKELKRWIQKFAGERVLGGT